MTEKEVVNPRDYSWVVNRTKLDRAVRELTDAKKPITEEAVKAGYVALAGLLLEDATPAVQEVVKAKKAKK